MDSKTVRTCPIMLCILHLVASNTGQEMKDRDRCMQSCHIEAARLSSVHHLSGALASEEQEEREVGRKEQRKVNEAQQNFYYIVAVLPKFLRYSARYCTSTIGYPIIS